ncbi:hypothetical protein BSL78_25121 [Apostichopus japonicus]|uniref:CCHC-type domain-containing protein n=1 Tax=Stichopus japonicus TaxID=307972 RepID=A0A2G8JQP9_STIJA|nr:hypothetical protein BSL78_25121 [Apostichopus japonicus]
MSTPEVPEDRVPKATPSESSMKSQGDKTGHLLQILLQSQQQMQQLFESQQRSQEHMQQIIQMQQQPNQQNQSQTMQLLQEIKDQRTLDQERLFDTLQNPTSSSPQGATGGQSVRSPIMTKLPKIQFPTFAGEILKWPNCLESFEINVDSQPQLSNKQKLHYLLQLLTGPAYDKIKGLGLEGKYVDAVAILKEQYGEKMYQKRALWNSLHSMKQVRENMGNLEKFVDETNALTVALKRQGVPELTDKLPRSLTTEMNKMRFLQNKHKNEQSMQEYLDFLKNVHLLTITTGNTSKTRESKEESSDPIQHPTNKLPTANFAQDASQVYRRPCLFCGKGNHWSDECRKVTDTIQRREMVQKEGRCFKCLNKGHLFKNCKRKKPCFDCKDVNHNSAMLQERT